MPGPIGPDRFRTVAEAALEVRGPGQAEVLFMHEWGGLTRFAASRIHQSTWREDTVIRVRVVRDGRTGVSTTNDFSERGAEAAALAAREMAEVASPDPLFPGLPGPASVPEVDRYDEATAATSPEDRAAAIEALVGRCGEGFHAAGAYETAGAEIGLANSEGQLCYAPTSQASMSAVVSGGDGGAGFAEVLAPRAADVDPEAVGERAARKARDGQGPRDAPPGDYEVVLEPAAVATLVAFLAYLGFGGRSLVEGRSCFAGREGERVAAPIVSIHDDALDAGTLGIPFDFEGTPKRRVDLIGEGVFRGAVHDRRSAAQAGTESTGHALPPPNPEGPFPLNLVMATGDASIEDMVAATGRGLLVTRFHYTNVVHPKEAVITGMTRDGTFLIEDGKVTHPVKNLRFTQSILEALEHTDMVGGESELAGEFFFSASRIPAIRCSRFRFTGRSDH
ncbi:MAG: TldD/PmbA family protein [Actinobacteria bacterium]|nr:TldD/PmbA family protein [Actinomycetota bacterium]